MRFRKIFVYLLIPVLLTGFLMAMYFSGNIVLQRLVSPKLPPLTPDAWREFGLLENLQNLLLLSLVAVAILGAVRKAIRGEKVLWLLVAAGALFVFLEEIDYGTHFSDFLATSEEFEWCAPMDDWTPELVSQIDFVQEPANLHNQPGLNKAFKRTGDALILVLFVVVPLLALRIRKPWFRYCAPDTYAVFAVAAMVLLSSLTHYLGDLDTEAVRAAQEAGNFHRELGSISKNLSEFRELNFYYLLLVYCADVVFMRRSPAAAAAATSAADEASEFRAA